MFIKVEEPRHPKVTRVNYSCVDGPGDLKVFGLLPSIWSHCDASLLFASQHTKALQTNGLSDWHVTQAATKRQTMSTKTDTITVELKMDTVSECATKSQKPFVIISASRQ